MEKEIRKDVRDYILDEVNLSLARLGLDKKLIECERKKDGNYKLTTPPVTQMPMLFKTLIVEGEIGVWEQEETSPYKEYAKAGMMVRVDLSYKWEYISGGRNGCDIGSFVFFVRDNLPPVLGDNIFSAPNMYIHKIEGITI